jgi:YD repeat-containing protein
VATRLADFTYDDRGRLDLRSEGTAAQSKVDYGYDLLGRLTSQQHVFAGAAGGVTTTFAYNPANQVVGRTRDNEFYAWTGHKNVERAYNVNALNQYTRAGQATFSHDPNGNLASETSPDGTINYVYDIENRLVQASGAMSAALRYDPLGRLYKVGSTTFLYDGDALVAEYNGTGALAERYVHGSAEGVDDPLLWFDNGVKRWLHADHQGSIVAVTDDGGAMHAINAYDEYGVPKLVNGVAVNAAGSNIPASRGSRSSGCTITRRGSTRRRWGGSCRRTRSGMTTRSISTAMSGTIQSTRRTLMVDRPRRSLWRVRDPKPWHVALVQFWFLERSFQQIGALRHDREMVSSASFRQAKLRRAEIVRG